MQAGQYHTKSVPRGGLFQRKVESYAAEVPDFQSILAEDRPPVLVVDDEPAVAALLADILEELGCIAATAESVPEALAKLELGTFVMAILDINIGDRQVFPVARALIEKNIPFAFASGASAAVLPAAFRGVPFLKKPFHIDDLSAALSLASAGR